MSIVINGDNKYSQLHADDQFSVGPRGFGASYHITSNKELYEPQRTNTFEFIVPDLDQFPHILEAPHSMQEAGEVLRLAVKTAKFSHPSIEPLEERRVNSVQKFAGQVTWSDGEITIHDWIGAEPKMILMSWFNQAYDAITDKVGVMSDYKINAQLIEYSPDWQPVRKWNLFGCWVASVEEGDWDHEKSEERAITAKIVFDKMLPVIENTI